MIARWTRLELTIAALSAGIVLFPLLYRVDYSGSWDGDPGVHLRLTMEAVNVAVAEVDSGGDPLRGMLQTFYRFPKMLHDILLAGFILAANGVERIDYRTAVFYGAWFSTLWTLVGAVALYICVRQVASRVVALACMPLVVLCAYVLHYANFPRQNMPSHAIVWLATALYMVWRSRSPRLRTAQALTLGVLFGVSVPVHYTSVYWFFALVAAEFALLWQDREWRGALRSLILIVCAASLVWLALDLFYFVYSNRYPDDHNWFGHNSKDRGSSFLQGMAHTQNRIASKVMATKVLPPVWWFLPGFVYRNVGVVGSIATGLGTLLLLREASGGAGGSPERRRAVTITLASLAVLVFISLQSFQAARKLMPLYPALALAAVIGMERLAVSGAALVRRGGWPPRALAVLPGLAVLVLGQAVSFGPDLSRVFHARRDVGYMREYLRERGITKVLVDPAIIAAPMAAVQTPIRGLESSWADTYDYIVLHRLFPRGGVAAAQLLNKVRRRNPIVAFDNQVAVPMWWYEFPLKASFFDPADPLTHSRALYRWKHIAPFYQHRLRH